MLRTNSNSVTVQADQHCVCRTSQTSGYVSQQTHYIIFFTRWMQNKRRTPMDFVISKQIRSNAQIP